MSESKIGATTKTKKEEQQKAKRYIKDIFSDYETRNCIKDAEIEGLNLMKKKNVLGIIIKSDKYIEIKEIWYFEKFLIERFSFQNIELVIKYEEGVRLRTIEEEWRNIICYMAHKYPLTKPLLLMKSDLNVEENTITVKCM